MKKKKIEKKKTPTKKVTKKKRKNPVNPIYREITKEHHTVKPWWDTKRTIKNQFVHDQWYLFINNRKNYEVFQFIMYGSVDKDNKLIAQGNEPIFYKYRQFSNEKIITPYNLIVYYWPDGYWVGPFRSKNDSIKYAESNGYQQW